MTSPQGSMSAFTYRKQSWWADEGWLYMTPLIAAPTLPLVRIWLRDRPKARTWVFGGLVAFFLAHGAFLISKASRSANEREQRRIEEFDRARIHVPK
ncbi:hypothetical protein QOT17_003548 [Balamuthia mandrillaris]